MSQSSWSGRVPLQSTWTTPKVRSDRNRRISYLSYEHPKVFLALLPGLLMGSILAHHPFHRQHIQGRPPPLDILAPWALPVSSPLWSYRQMNLLHAPITSRTTSSTTIRATELWSSRIATALFPVLPMHREEEGPLRTSSTWSRGQNVAPYSIFDKIGINYIRQDAALRGCINDARNIERFLCGKSPFCVSCQTPLSDVTHQRDSATIAMI